MTRSPLEKSSLKQQNDSIQKIIIIIPKMENHLEEIIQFD